jgi:hypothetical protein
MKLSTHQHGLADLLWVALTPMLAFADHNCLARGSASIEQQPSSSPHRSKYVSLKFLETTKVSAPQVIGYGTAGDSGLCSHKVYRR